MLESQTSINTISNQLQTQLLDIELLFQFFIRIFAFSVFFLYFLEFVLNDPSFLDQLSKNSWKKRWFCFWGINFRQDVREVIWSIVIGNVGESWFDEISLHGTEANLILSNNTRVKRVEIDEYDITGVVVYYRIEYFSSKVLGLALPERFLFIDIWYNIIIVIELISKKNFISFSSWLPQTHLPETARNLTQFKSQRKQL